MLTCDENGPSHYEVSTLFKKRPPKRREAARRDHPGRASFVEFCRECGPVLAPDFVVTKQIELFAHLVEPALVLGLGFLRLILVWPPGTGKTWCGKLFLAWCFGLHPNWHELALCLSADLASDIGADVKRIIASAEFARVFPGVEVPRDASSKKHFEVMDRDALGRGEFNAAGRSTRFTGRRGKVLYQDDLINEKEADSLVALADAKNTIRASYSRGHPSGYHWVICNTRYREDDPIGYILDKYAAEGPWTVVVLPSILEKEDGPQSLPNGWRREVGDVLYPYSLNVAGLLAKKATYIAEGSAHEWYGQHKGQPKPPTGRKVDRNDVRSFAELVNVVRGRCERTVMIVDTARKAKESNDPTGIVIVGQQGQKHHTLHVEADRLPFLDLCVRVARLCLEWRPQLVLVEDSANGTALYETLTRQGYAVEVRSNGSHENVPFHTPIEMIPVTSDLGSKVQRFDAAVPPAIRQGLLWVPLGAPWREPFLEQLSGFPRVPNDDLCDCLAIWFKWASENGATQAGPPQVPTAVKAAAAVPGRPQPQSGWQSLTTRKW